MVLLAVGPFLDRRNRAMSTSPIDHIPTALDAAIDTREELLGILAEAAEIEHNLMCCYLYAAFSLKQDADEGLSDDELAAVRRWRRTIIDVAVEEMAHLTMVANIMAALGGTPHFGRANFPIPAGYHPSGIVVRLAPFTLDTLDHFIFLERPESIALADGAGFEPAAPYRRGHVAGRIMPGAWDYDTVGQLYAAIAHGLERMADTIGEAALFVGDPARQLGRDVSNLRGIARVRCLRTAQEAIEAIIEQGEGAPDSSEASHFARFRAIRGEYEALLAANPAFTPARPAAHNPLMRPPVSASADRVWVCASPAAELLDVANAAYNQMLRLLLQAYAETRGIVAQRVLADAATSLMYAISPLASELTRHPAADGDDSCTAGMSFATLRTTTTLPPGPGTDAILVERLGEIARASAAIGETLPRLAPVAAQVDRIARHLRETLADLSAKDAAPVSPAPVAVSPASALPDADVADEDGFSAIEGEGLTLLYNGERCIHARHCVLGQPGVFKANEPGAWIDPDGASTEALVTVAHMCPSGAIRYRRKDGGPDEAAPPINLAQLRDNGPIGLRGDLRIAGQAPALRATLCRCGASRNKPFCDGSHAEAGFIGSGEPATRPSSPLVRRNGPVDILPLRNGPLQVDGNLEICAGTGRTVDRITSIRLCRCGQSADKPFCDNSHERVGFIAD